jgi:prephenate dehydrogenase
MKIAIIGAGKMGSLFAKYLSNKYAVYLYDKDVRRIKEVHRITLDKLSAMDLVIIAVPLEDTSSVIEKAAGYMRRGSRLMEISSVKHYSYKSLIKVGRRYGLKVLSIHPLFGEGLQSFKEAKMILIPINEDDHTFVRELFEEAKITEMDVREHDKIMAIVLGLTHLTNFIIAKTIINEDYDRLKEVGGTTFRLQTILLEGVMNDPSSLSIPLMVHPYMKRYAKRFKKIVDDTCNAIIKEDKKHLSNSYRYTRDKFSNLDESYRIMYDILDKLNNK